MYKEILFLTKMEDPKTVFKRLKENVEKSQYQKDLHYSEENGEQPTLIRTHFLNSRRRETWSYRNNFKLDATADLSDSSKICYRARTIPFHGLLYTILIQKLPTVKASPGFEICWCPNVGSNIVKTAEFQVNDTVWQTLDSVYFDDYHMKLSSQSEKEQNRNLGNVSALRTWSTELPAFTTFFRIPWFYSLHTSKMFPLYYCGKEDKIDHILYLRRNLKDLLMIRSADTGEMIPFDEACLILDETKTELPVPEMRGEYVMMSDMECEHNRCNATESTDIFDIDNVKSFSSETPIDTTVSTNIRLKDLPFPVHTIHWKAENHTASSLNYLSNYSTNAENHLEGESPIQWVSLSSPNGIVFKQLENYVSERIVPSNHFPRTPDEAGYGTWTNAVYAGDSLYPKPGIKLDDGELTFKLVDSKDKYVIHTRCVYTYRVVFKDYPKNESERNGKGIEVEISGDL